MASCSFQNRPGTEGEASEEERRKMKFCKPHWPPVISAEESKKRRGFWKSLEEESCQATPSTSKQWPPKMQTVKVSVPPCATLAVLPAPAAVTDVALKRVPRATAWRRRKRAKEDKKALKHGKATPRVVLLRDMFLQLKQRGQKQVEQREWVLMQGEGVAVHVGWPNLTDQVFQYRGKVEVMTQVQRPLTSSAWLQEVVF
ncbi:hypothetical protein Q8A67_010361 [Cirrhinus molitorella]|uniref:Uncharacterized protein n=1 Tax=Cirrhinus molitorella TaxID=172907 RepID=A0AA88PSQ0_9TELE|nr:hypothetical protein Q8A67_010361 [Cirrhinus molitorella]